ncbi:MAG: ATP-binding cassette domain-containing protein, partial [Mycobacteriales bacterium]
VSARMRARHVGVLTQSNGLLGHLTVLENVQLAASLRRGTGPSPRELLEGLGLAAVLHATPRTLSGGETARASLAAALVGAPAVLLADEPTAEVSNDEEDTVLELLTQWRPANGATVIVTHSAAVAAYADRVVHLVDGRIEGHAA